MAHCQSASRNARPTAKQKRQLEVPLRRSARLNPSTQLDMIGAFHRSVQESTSPRTFGTVACDNVEQTEDLGFFSNRRKRAKEHLDLQSHKRCRLSHGSLVQAPSHEDLDPIDHWRREGFYWPKRDWLKNNMDRYLPRKKSISVSRRKRSNSDLEVLSTGTPSTGSPGTNTPSDQKSREEKSAQYRDPRYETLLATKGSFMYKDSIGITSTSKTFCGTLLKPTQSVPSDTLFRDDIFEETCEAIRNRNESRVIWDISQLLVPPAESLAIRGEKELRILIQSVNEGWNNSIPFTKTRPQPDYAVGFRRESFSKDQLKKIGPFVGDIFTEVSLFMGTYYQYFPFLACEVKCGAAALDIADRQNAHSMTLAVRGFIELFRLVGREKELDREILAFSISHDHRSVRIYGHYAVVVGKDTTYYRHPIHTFDFTALDGREKWTAYSFTKNVYKKWMPPHFKRLCSAIDAIPADIQFDVSQSELRFTEHSGLSRDIASHHLSNSDAATIEDHSGQLEPIIPDDTPDTSVTQSSPKQNKSKKQKKKKL